MLLRSATTDVTQPAATPSNDAFPREPMWKRPSVLESVTRAPVAAYLPLLDTRF